MLKQMMKAAQLIGVTSLLVLTSSSPTRAQKAPPEAQDGVVQKLAHGEINWSTKTVTATGSGTATVKDGSVGKARLMAERAAKMDAVRNIVETIQGIQVTGTRNAADVMSNGEIKSRIDGMAQGFKVVNTQYYSDGSVDVTVSMPIDANLTNALVEKPKPGATKPATVPTSGIAVFSGLVVNARGLGVTPSMAPRIVDESGKQIYSAEIVSDQGLQQGGIASYAKSEDKATERTGAKPLIVKALRLADKSKTDLVIANADADKLRDPNTNLSFLADGKVVILVD
jgi:hypothetical protein